MNWPARKFKETLSRENFAILLHIVEVFVLVTGLYLVVIQINDSRKVNSGQIALDITRDIYSSDRYQKNPQIIKLIQRGQPILVSNGGPIAEEEIDNLLGEWDLVARFNQLGILPDDLVYQQLSFDVVKAYENKEIRDYIERIRSKYRDSLIYADFEWLAKWAEETSKAR